MKNLFLTLFISIISYNSIYSQNIQSPSEFLGYELGTQFSRHNQVIDYFKYVSSVLAKQVILEKYGETNERRPLYVSYISSEENIKNIENIRKNNLNNAGIINLKTTNSSNTAIVWLSYNVHGNESSSTEAAMKTLYKLVTDDNNWLDNTLVILDPCINPDGRDRYANWYNQNVTLPLNTDLNTREHNEPWPGGRANHYLFDLNRDWAWVTQKESRDRLKIYNKWLPHIHVDFHEQGIDEPYYFAPAAEPLHEQITDWQREFQVEIGNNHAKYFDKNGWLYFTKETFDLLYPSYGDTYPTFLGAIGMTYEQAGGGDAGLGVLNNESEIVSLIDRINHHTTTGLSTVEISSKNASKLNNEFIKFFKSQNNNKTSYVIQGNKDKIQSLTSLLDKHEISYGFSKSSHKVNGYNYQISKDTKIEINSNDLIIKTNQPKGKLVEILFEQQTKLSDPLTYDITAWSLPYAYGLNATVITQEIETIKNEFDFEANKINLNSIGYIFNWRSLNDAQFLSQLLNTNFKIRYNTIKIKTNGKEFNPGSIIVLERDQDIDNFHSTITSIANSHNRKSHNILTGISEHGPDLGSSDIKLIPKTKVAVLTGDGISSLNYGAIWHFFEKQLRYPLTHLNYSTFNRTNLSDIDVIILPSGFYKTGSAHKDKVKDWVTNGGKLIAIDRALNSISSLDIGLIKNTNTIENNISFVSDFSSRSNQESNNNHNLIKYNERNRTRIDYSISGAIFKIQLDNTHPMAYGYGDNYQSLKIGNSSYKLLENGYNVGYIDSEPRLTSGFAGKKALKKISNSLVFGHQNYGSGSFIYMIDNPLFRSFWENGKLLLVNSIFFVD
ncbi:M14 family metallopeptidase [Flavobacteriaceae bacterium]|nr:M14 family metallopeptidase [Flavobacteriaceae bacterium]